MEFSNISTITADIQKLQEKNQKLIALIIEANEDRKQSECKAYAEKLQENLTIQTKFVDALPNAMTRQLDLFPQNDQAQASPPKRISVLPSIFIAPQPNPSPAPETRPTSAPSSSNLVNSNGGFCYGGQAGLFSMLQQRRRVEVYRHDTRERVARFSERLSHTRDRMDSVPTQPPETRQIARHYGDGRE